MSTSDPWGRDHRSPRFGLDYEITLDDLYALCSVAEEFDLLLAYEQEQREIVWLSALPSVADTVDEGMAEETFEAEVPEPTVTLRQALAILERLLGALPVVADRPR